MDILNRLLSTNLTNIRLGSYLEKNVTCNSAINRFSPPETSKVLARVLVCFLRPTLSPIPGMQSLDRL